MTSPHCAPAHGDALPELAARERIGAAGGFIQEQNLRPVQQRSRHGQALLEPSGQLRARQPTNGVRARTDSWPRQCARAASSPFEAVGAREEVQVLTDRQLPIERELLRDIADRCCRAEARLCAHRLQRPAKLPAEAGRSPHSMRKVVVLPAPFGPSSPNISPRLTAETHMIHRDEFAEAPHEIADLNDGVSWGAANRGLLPAQAPACRRPERLGRLGAAAP
jgi:hypothetical protein